MNRTEPPRRLARTFGPGLLWAGTAIGVSHLVQSTRAGADAGFSLLWVILIALALKYPFFEFGPRYAAATGESLIEGYHRLGRWAVWVYFLITLSTALIIQTTVGLFTASVFTYVLGVTWSIVTMGTLVMGGAGLLLWKGRFRALDSTMKGVLLLLAACTLVAATMALPGATASYWVPWPSANSDVVAFGFILALVGWMPSAFDIAVWSSLWTLAKNRASGVKVTVEEALLDFRIGYVGAGIIAIAFLTLGATVMYASDQSFSADGTTFSLQLVDLYARTLGEWSRPVILIAVVTTMFSTMLTVMDGFPRAISRTYHVLRVGLDVAFEEDKGKLYWFAMWALAGLTLVVFRFFAGSLTTMVDFATIVSFITAPVLGYLNLRAVTADHVPVTFRPNRVLRVFSYLGLVLLGGTAVGFSLSLVWG